MYLSATVVTGRVMKTLPFGTTSPQARRLFPHCSHLRDSFLSKHLVNMVCLHPYLTVPSIVRLLHIGRLLSSFRLPEADSQNSTCGCRMTDSFPQCLRGKFVRAPGVNFTVLGDPDVLRSTLCGFVKGRTAHSWYRMACLRARTGTLISHHHQIAQRFLGVCVCTRDCVHRTHIYL